MPPPELQLKLVLIGTFIALLEGCGFWAGSGGVPCWGGEKVKIKPLGGYTVFVISQVAVFIVPAVVAVQSVVVVRLLKSWAESPLKPTCTVLAVLILTTLNVP